MMDIVRPSQHGNGPEYVRFDIYNVAGALELTLLASGVQRTEVALDIAGCGLRLDGSKRLGELIRSDVMCLRHVSVDGGPATPVVFIALNTSIGQTVRVNRDLPAWFRACNGLDSEVQLYDFTLQARVVR